MLIWPSEEWTAAFAELINESTEYREAAHDWEGSVVYHFQAEPDRALGEDVYGWFDLWHGRCREARQVTSEEAQGAAFLVSAPYSTWKRVLTKELDPMRAVMQGHIKLRGDLPKAVRYTKASMILQDLAGKVPDTEYLDELPSERLRELAAEGLPVAVPGES
ncbi:MAG: SCP2 sterol-binding domain-containing protein [Actinomycetota bacterium]